MHFMGWRWDEEITSGESCAGLLHQSSEKRTVKQARKWQIEWNLARLSPSNSRVGADAQFWLYSSLMAQGEESMVEINGSHNAPLAALPSGWFLELEPTNIILPFIVAASPSVLLTCNWRIFTFSLFSSPVADLPDKSPLSSNFLGFLEVDGWLEWWS